MSKFTQDSQNSWMLSDSDPVFDWMSNINTPFHDSLSAVSSEIPDERFQV